MIALKYLKKIKQASLNYSKHIEKVKRKINNFGSDFKTGKRKKEDLKRVLMLIFLL